MKKRLNPFIVAYLLPILAILLITVPVLATVYTANILVTESAGTNYGMIGLKVFVNNTWMAANGFINADGRDVKIELGGTAVPRMVADNVTYFAGTVSPYSSQSYAFTTNNTPSNFAIIPGYDGYITTTDNATLELSDNGTISIANGYIETTAGASKYLVYKPYAFDVKVSETVSGNITARIPSSQVIMGGSVDTLLAGATEYNCLMGGGNWNATESINYQVMPTSGAVSQLYVKLSAAVGVGATYTFTLMKNGAAQALTVTLVAGETTGSDLENVASYTAGDTVSIRSTSTGVPGAPFACWTTVWRSDIEGETIFLANATAVIGATTYYGLQGQLSVGSVTETYFKTPMPTDGTFSKLYVQLSADPGNAPDDYVFTLRHNTADSVLTTTIVADDTASSNTTQTVTVVAGDLMDFKITPENVPASAPTCAIGMVFTPTIAGESVVMGGSNTDVAATAATEYNLLQGSSILYLWDAVEANRYELTQATTISKLYVNLGTGAPDNGAGVDSYTYTIREAGATTGLSVTIADASTSGNDVTHTNTLANGAYMTMESVPANAPANTNPCWSFVCTNIGVSVSATGVTSAEHDVVAEIHSPLFSLGIDSGVSENITPLSDSLVLNNPYFQPELNNNSFTSIDYNAVTCNVSNATYSSTLGRVCNGTTSYIVVNSDADLNDIAAFSLEIWVYPLSMGENSQGYLFSKDANAGASGSGIQFQMQNVNRLYFAVTHAVTDVKREPAADCITLNAWNHIVGTWDGTINYTGMHIYVNGVEVTYATNQNAVGARLADNLKHFYLGNTSGNNRTINGNIGEQRIYNRVLSPAEVLRNYNATKSKYMSGNIYTLSTLAVVPDNSSDWIWGQSNVMPYCDSINLTVNCAQVLHYEPNTIIIGTTLPDRETGDGLQNGIFTWGSNPASVGADISHLEFEAATSIGSEITTPDSIDILTAPDNMSHQDTEMGMINNVFYSLVLWLSGVTDIDVIMLWWWLSAVLAITTLVIIRRFLNNIWIAGAMATGVSGMFVAMGMTTGTAGALEFWSPVMIMIATIFVGVYLKTSEI